MSEPSIPAVPLERSSEYLLAMFIRVRLMFLPFVLVFLTAMLIAGEPTWKIALLGGLFIPILALFVAESVHLRRTGRPRLGFAGNGVLVLIAQTVVLFVTGGIESPILKVYPAFAILIGIFLGSPRRFVLVLVYIELVIIFFAAGATFGFLPRTVPALLDMGPGFADRPIYVWTCAGFILAFQAFSSFMGARLRRGLDGLTIQADAARRQVVESMTARNRELVSVANTVAHELKNPLAALRGLCQLESREAAEGSKTRERLERMLGEVDRMRAVLDGFRSFTRPLGSLTVKTASLGEIARDVAGLGEGLAHGRGVRVSSSGDVEAQCDPQKVKQALLNLVQNSIEAGAHRVELRVEAAAADARIVVRDDGPGLAPDARPFERGYTTKSEGSGIGLVVARAIAEQHGGSLALEGGPGCIATLRLPRTYTNPFEETL